MKFKWMEIQNLTSLKGKHFIDFEALSDDSLFSIVGPTGSGKSTILNAISLALYGQLYKNNLNQTDLVTLGESKALIKLAFVIGQQEYLSEWYSRTRKKDGSLLKNPKYGRELFKYYEGQKELADIQIENLIGLDFNQFSKTIILNQGEFARFLTSTFAERKDILEKLCHLEILKDLSKLLNQKLTEVQSQKDQKESELKAYQDGFIPIVPIEKTLQIEVTKNKDDQIKLQAHQQKYDFIKQTLKVLSDHNIKKEELKSTEIEKKAFLKDFETIESELFQAKIKLEGANQKIKDMTPILSKAINDKSVLNQKTLLVQSHIKSIKDHNIEINELRADLEKLNEEKNQLALEEKSNLSKMKFSLDANEIQKKIKVLNETKVKIAQKQQLIKAKDEFLARAMKITLERIQQINDLNLKLNEIYNQFKTVKDKRHNLTEKHLLKINQEIQIAINALLKELVLKSHSGEDCPLCHKALSQNDLDQIKLRAKISKSSSSKEFDLAKDLYQQSIQTIDRLIEGIDYRVKDINPLDISSILNIDKSLNKINALKLTKNIETKSIDLENELLLVNRQNQIKRELEYKNEQIHLKKKHLAKVIQKNDELDNANKSLNEEIKKLKDGLGIYLQKDPTIELNKIQEEYNQIEKQKDAIFDKFKESNQKLNSLKDKIEFYSDQLKDFNITYNHLRKELVDLELPEKISEILPDALEHAFDISANSIKSLTETIEAANQNIGNLNQQIKNLYRLKEKIDLLTKEIDEIKKDIGPKIELNQLIARDEFRNYVLKRVEENLVAQANIELKNLCDGRYKIVIKSSKSRINEFFIQDLFLSSETRRIATLSGGETFMTSLAMALALSELSRGTTEINAFFIDEGFATLDDDALDDVMELLQRIKSTGKQVGVISHVSKLKNRIPNSLILNKKHDGHSTISQDLSF